MAYVTLGAQNHPLLTADTRACEDGAARRCVALRPERSGFRFNLENTTVISGGRNRNDLPAAERVSGRRLAHSTKASSCRCFATSSSFLRLRSRLLAAGSVSSFNFKFVFAELSGTRM